MVVGESEVFVRVMATHKLYDSNEIAVPLASISGTEPPVALVGAIGDPKFNVTEAGVLYYPGNSPERVLFPTDLQVIGATAVNGFLGLSFFTPKHLGTVPEDCTVYECDATKINFCPGDSQRLLSNQKNCVANEKTTGFLQHSPGVVLRPRVRWLFYNDVNTTKHTPPRFN